MSREIRSVLVVYKRSTFMYVQEENDSHMQELLAQNEPSVTRMMKGHEENEASIEHVRHVLERRGVDAVWEHRPDMEKLGSFDLVISLGGDGTLLEAARAISDSTPLLGIHSSRISSVGYLCAGEAEDFEEIFDRFVKEELPTYRLTRIEARCNGELILPYALNDILYAHDVPAATTRYDIGMLYDGQDVLASYEEQRSSGVWVSTATGSTAAIHSAGGKIMPLQSRRLQYLVRELYAPPGIVPFHFDGGFVAGGQKLEIVSKMRKSTMFIDGPWNRFDVRYNDKLVFQPSSQYLMLYGDIERTRRQRHHRALDR